MIILSAKISSHNIIVAFYEVCVPIVSLSCNFFPSLIAPPAQQSPVSISPALGRQIAKPDHTTADPRSPPNETSSLSKNSSELICLGTKAF